MKNAMQIVHPQKPWNGVAPENVYIALDEQGRQCAVGTLTYTRRPHVFPDCPINVYFTLNHKERGQYMVLGALMAHATQLRAANQEEAARLYTVVKSSDEATCSFYRECGFNLDISEDEVRLHPRYSPETAMVGTTFDRQQNLRDPQAQAGISARFVANGLEHLTPAVVARLASQPLCQVWAMMRGDEIMGECIINGFGDVAYVSGVYVREEYRRQGRARALLTHALSAIHSEPGAPSDFRAFVMSASAPQVRLVRALGAELIDKKQVHPFVDL